MSAQGAGQCARAHTHTKGIEDGAPLITHAATSPPMHLAHGWPRALATWATGQPVYLGVGGGLAAVVTASSLELWSAGRSRVRLANASADEEGGAFIAGAWSGSRRRLAVLVSDGCWNR